MTIIIYITIVLLALFFPDINLFFNLIGSTAANMIAYILPAAFYVKVAQPGKMKTISFVIIGVGIVGAILGLSGEIFELATA
jgi:hypothetical protein